MSIRRSGWFLGSSLGLAACAALLAGACGASTEKRAAQGQGGEAGQAGAGDGGTIDQGNGVNSEGGLGGLGAEGGAGGAAGATPEAGGAGGEGGGPSCTAELACDTNPGFPCLVGRTECSDNVTDCIDAEEAADGSACTDGSCKVGICSPARIVFNTGVDASGASLAGGEVDPHYTLIQSADTTFVGPDAIVTSAIADGYWVAQSETSKWIAPSANQAYPGATPCNSAGAYVYRTTFVVTEAEAATLTIQGAWGADNSGTAIRLNDVSLGLAAPSYAPLTAFTIASGFVTGMNTLDFEILDIGCPNGLRVELTASIVPPS